MIRSRELLGNGGLMIEKGCNGFGLLLCWWSVQCSLGLYNVWRGHGRFGRRITLLLRELDGSRWRLRMKRDGFIEQKRIK
jgi:hypothetical protein